MRPQTAARAHENTGRSGRCCRSKARTRTREIRRPQNARSGFARRDPEERLQASRHRRLKVIVATLRLSGNTDSRLATCLVVSTMLIAASEALSKIEVTASNSSIKNLWQEHGYILPAFCLTILVCAWFVTWGD